MIMKLFKRQSKSEDGHYGQLQSIEECLQKSQEEPQYILKHSTTCPISTRAKQEVDAFLSKKQMPFSLVIVQEQRPLSNKIASHLNVKHESPQVLRLHDQKVTHVFNHGEITKKNLESTIT